MESTIAEGKIIFIMPKKENGQWSSQQFVIEDTTGKYPNKVAFEVFGQDKIEQFDIRHGEYVKVFLNISAKEWNGRWFNNVQAWRVEKQGHVGGQSFNRPTSAPEQKTKEVETKQDDLDGLPF